MAGGRQIYLGKRSSGRGGRWVSFEDDPCLTQTRWNIYGRCVPCMEDLWQQLDSTKSTIQPNEALNCWKVVVVLEDEEQCLALLELFERNFLAGHAKVRGRYGDSTTGGLSQAVVFQTQDMNQRDRLKEEAILCAQQVNAEAEIFFARACTNLYGEILGPWQEWKEVTPIRHPEKIEEVKERIKRLLYHS